MLDCPTRGVDVGVKAYIYQVLRQSKENNIAIIMISDELTEAIGMADRILVMKDGNIIEQGRHEELLAKKGFYANLYESQFAIS